MIWLREVTDDKLFRVAAWGTQGHVAAHFNAASTSTSIEWVVSNKTSVISLYPTIVSHNYTIGYNLPKNGTVVITIIDVLEGSFQHKNLMPQQAIIHLIA